MQSNCYLSIKYAAKSEKYDDIQSNSTYLDLSYHKVLQLKDSHPLYKDFAPFLLWDILSKLASFGVSGNKLALYKKVKDSKIEARCYLTSKREVNRTNTGCTQRLV